MNDQRAFPLHWPPGWPRTQPHNRAVAPFFTVVKGERRTLDGYIPKYNRERSMAEATDGLLDELLRLDASCVVISSNVELRQDGLPMSNRRRPTDPGAAVYFNLKASPVALACDKWIRVEDNLWAITKHVEAIRGQERWGVGTTQQAFRGYMALPPGGSSAGRSWWDVLGCAHDAPADLVKDAYRKAARAAHPDNGGSHERMVEVNSAWDQARRGGLAPF